MVTEYERELKTVLFAWSRAHFDEITPAIRAAVIESGRSFDAWELSEERKEPDPRQPVDVRARDWSTTLEASIDRVSDAQRVRSKKSMAADLAWEAVRKDFNDGCGCPI